MPERTSIERLDLRHPLELNGIQFGKRPKASKDLWCGTEAVIERARKNGAHFDAIGVPRIGAGRHGGVRGEVFLSSGCS
jgi:hypothetical protein